MRKGGRHSDLTRQRMRQSHFISSYRPKRPATIKPTLLDIAWLAGFLEGEGNFERQRVRASQVNLTPLTWIQARFGGQLSLQKRYDPNWADCYNWTVSGARARGIALTVYSFMSPLRQTQIRESLTWRHSHKSN